MTVYERLAVAMQSIASETFSKSGTVNAGSNNSYPFIPISQILDVVRRAHAKAGIVVVFGTPQYDPQQRERRWEFETTNRYGDKTTWYAANGHIDVTIYGADGDSIETVVGFEAKDNSDKLTNKIYTNAERCLYRTLYAIDEGGEDPEAVNVENVVEVSQEQVEKKKEENRARARAQAKEDPFFKVPEKKEGSA